MKKVAWYTLDEPANDETREFFRKTPGYKLNGQRLRIEYDSEQPCIVCGLPVEEASVGGTMICPMCDMGMHRDGAKGDHQRPWKVRYPDEYQAAYPGSE